MTEAVPGWSDRLLAEQNQRWQRGERVSVESYLDQYPDLRDRDDVVLDLVCNEVFLRTRAGEAPALDEYLRRFPRLAAELRVQFEIHQAFTPEPVRPTANGTSAKPGQPFCVRGYEILDELGRGGMGVVYRARQVVLDRVVALKVLRAGSAAGKRLRARLVREAQAVARLQHPNIVQIYEVSQVEGQPYCALEFVEGGSLADRLAGRPQPPAEAAALVEVLARAMHHAHERGVVHRDLKPANVLLQLGNGEWGVGNGRPEGPPLPGPPSPFATPKITDFGLAMRLDLEVSATQRGAVMGTAGYMAPEQARGDTEAIGPASDVYGLGAILYEMLTGRPPFLPAATLLATVLQIETQEPERPSRLQGRVPPDLEAVCLKCLAKRPRERYSSAAALADDLQRFRQGRTVSARVPALPERLARWTRRRLVPLAGAVGLLALLAVLAVKLGGRASSRPEAEEPPAASGTAEPDSRARFHGTITAIRPEGRTLTIALGAHSRNKVLKNAKTFTFKLHAGTRYEVVGRPGTSGPQPAELADLRKGDAVTVQASGEGASRADVVTVSVAGE